MIYAYASQGGTSVMDARRGGARDTGFCLWCDKPVYLVKASGELGYKHHNKRHKMECGTRSIGANLERRRNR